MSSNINKKEISFRKGQSGHFNKLVIQKVVRAVERGVPRRDLIARYGVTKSALSGWMQDYGSPAYKASQRGHLSQQQKRSMVRAIQEGRMTIEEAKIAYNISMISTVKKWLRDARRENEELVALNKLLMAKKEDNPQPDPDPNKKALEEALKKLAEAELKVKALNTLIDVAEEQFKISIRKKAGAKQSKE